MSTPQAQPFSDSTFPFMIHGKQKDTNYQATLAKKVSCTGIGIHSGKPIVLTLKPSLSETGFIFVRTDLQKNNQILGVFNNVTDTKMCTRISNGSGVSISTVEHILAALAGAHITNAIIEVNGPEIPIMDGSSFVFSQMIEKVGISLQNSQLKTVKILKPVRVSHNESYAEFLPNQNRLLTFVFNKQSNIGHASKIHEFTFDWDLDNFNHIISDARTFGFYEDAQKLRDLGLAQGASLNNTIVIQNDNTFMNPEGLRSEDELVRHKILDAIGDLSLAGMRILGHFRGVNSGHSLNNQLLRHLFNTPDAWKDY